MALPQPDGPHPAPAGGIRHWLRAILFTLALVGLVAAAIGADWAFALSALAVCAIGFGFFYLVFPGGGHFGAVMANALAVYACLFTWFHEANFTAAPRAAVVTALALPVACFLVGCFFRRAPIAAAIRARRRPNPARLPRTASWLPAVALVGALTFLLPRQGFGPQLQGAALLAAMAVIGLVTALAARDMILMLLDIAQVFEAMYARLDRLAVPVLAFLTSYSLLVVVFASLYRIAELSLGAPQFLVRGHLANISFADALYFSVITIATVGYGDITPAGPLVRGLASIEVVLGLLLLLFGFSEIMRTRDHKE